MKKLIPILLITALAACSKSEQEKLNNDVLKPGKYLIVDIGISLNDDDSTFDMLPIDTIGEVSITNTTFSEADYNGSTGTAKYKINDPTTAYNYTIDFTEISITDGSPSVLDKDFKILWNTSHIDTLEKDHPNETFALQQYADLTKGKYYAFVKMN